jgi:hypothetical protein
MLRSVASLKLVIFHTKMAVTVFSETLETFSYIVAYLLKAITVELEKQPLLSNDRENCGYTRDVSRQRLGIHVPAETNTLATIEVLLETGLSVGPFREVISGMKFRA